MKVPRKFLEKTKSTLDFCREVFSYFMTINGTVKAAALAYATLISIVPLVVLSFGLLLVFPSFSSYLKLFHQFVFRHFIPSSAQVIQNYAELFATNAKNLSAGGLAFFLMTAVLLIFMIETVFNVIWKVRTRRKGLPAFLMYWAILTLLPLVGGSAFALSVYIYSFSFLSVIMQFVSIFIPLILDWICYLFLYKTVPNCKVSFRHAAIGATIAAILLEIMKFGFRMYVTFFSSDSVVYGVLGAIPVFLLWLFLLWLLTLIGAIVTYKIGARSHQAKVLEKI